MNILEVFFGFGKDNISFIESYPWFAKFKLDSKFLISLSSFSINLKSKLNNFRIAPAQYIFSV